MQNRDSPQKRHENPKSVTVLNTPIPRRWWSRRNRRRLRIRITAGNIRRYHRQRIPIVLPIGLELRNPITVVNLDSPAPIVRPALMMRVLLSSELWIIIVVLREIRRSVMGYRMPQVLIQLLRIYAVHSYYRLSFGHWLVYHVLVDLRRSHRVLAHNRGGQSAHWGPGRGWSWRSSIHGGLAVFFHFFVSSAARRGAAGAVVRLLPATGLVFVAGVLFPVH